MSRQRLAMNCTTGEKELIDLTQEEIDDADAEAAANITAEEKLQSDHAVKTLVRAKAELATATDMESKGEITTDQLKIFQDKVTELEG